MATRAFGSFIYSSYVEIAAGRNEATPITLQAGETRVGYFPRLIFCLPVCRRQRKGCIEWPDKRARAPSLAWAR